MTPPVPVGTTPAAQVEFTKLPMSPRSLHAPETEDDVQLPWEALLGPVPAQPATERIRPPAHDCAATDQFILALAASCHAVRFVGGPRVETIRCSRGAGLREDNS